VPTLGSVRYTAVLEQLVVHNFHVSGVPKIRCHQPAAPLTPLSSLLSSLLSPTT
jgi:hypothetical protein